MLIVADLTGILPQYVIDFVFEHFNLIFLFVANSLVSIVQHIEEKEINMVNSLCSPEKYSWRKQSKDLSKNFAEKVLDNVLADHFSYFQYNSYCIALHFYQNAATSCQKIRQLCNGPLI